jgi:hypothetical protein
MTISEGDSLQPRRRPRVSDLALHMHTAGIIASLGTDRPGFITTEVLDGMSMDTTTAVVELELVGLWCRVRGGYTVDDDELDSLLRIIDEQLRSLAADCIRQGGHVLAEDRPGFCLRCMCVID